MYSKLQILVICNNHEYDVLMNGNVNYVENWGMNGECMHMKCKYVVTILWSIL
jgi:hypothetical protein